MMNYCVDPEETALYGSQLFALVADGTLSVRVHKEYPFTAQGLRDAQTDLVSGRTVGKLIVKVSD
jgi:NADPH2:quinone reductase